jgi:hypothetical protein
MRIWKSMLETAIDPSPRRAAAAKPAAALLAFSLTVVLLAGCAKAPVYNLMETPAIYHQAAVDPFAHLDPVLRGTVVSVFYATNRQPRSPNGGGLPYGNAKDSVLNMGIATLLSGTRISAGTNSTRPPSLPSETSRSRFLCWTATSLPDCRRITAWRQPRC